MTKALRFARAHTNTFVGVLLVTLLVSMFVSRQASLASHEPANKFAAAGSATDEIRPNGEHVILSETMKVSTPFDVAISATAECSILTYLRSAGSSTPGATDTSDTSGRIEMWVTLDGKRVPVQTTPTPDNGEVTFCNRDYERTINDREVPDGIDEQRDFIRTRTANGFNWFALDVGRAYDSPTIPAGAGNNIILVELHARYTKEGAQPCAAVTNNAAQEDCSDAFVGKRTLVVEPTNASVHEQVNTGPGAGN